MEEYMYVERNVYFYIVYFIFIFILFIIVLYKGKCFYCDIIFRECCWFFMVVKWLWIKLCYFFGFFGWNWKGLIII